MKSSKSAIGLGLITALASSLCCIVPFIALLAGTSSLAANFSWIEPAKPYLFAISVLALGFAWYQQLKPVQTDDCGACCDTKSTSFFQGKTFLSTVTVFAISMMAYPYLSCCETPGNAVSKTEVSKENLASLEFEIEGMTCGGCEKHITDAVYQLDGIVDITASYQNHNTTVHFDKSKTKKEDIETAIQSTGYIVLDLK